MSACLHSVILIIKYYIFKDSLLYSTLQVSSQLWLMLTFTTSAPSN